MSIAFAENDAKVLTGSDDRVIRYLDTNSLESGWQILNSSLFEDSSIDGTVGSPKCMAFNGDGTQIAVSYQGFPLSVWSLNAGYCIGKCKRAKAFRNDDARPSTSWFTVEQCTWNLVSGHIIGLYKAYGIFKWHPVTDEYREAPQSAAHEIAASCDGKLFITGNTNGIVRIWNFTHFTVIYQLSSAGQTAGLAFSPDCRRFYDLRDRSVIAREPDSLIRFSETEESIGEVTSEEQPPNLISQTSQESWIRSETVTVVAAAPGSTWYCVGNDEGAVDLLDTQTENAIELFRFPNFLGVSQLAWSQDATHVVAADLGGDIYVRRLVTSRVGAHGETEVKSLAAPKFDLDGRGIHQMLFNSDSTLLLIICEDCGQIWSLNDEVVIATLFDQGRDRGWLQHPTQRSIFLGFGVTDVRVFRWQDFSEQPRLCFQQDRPQLHSHTRFDSKEDHTLDLAQLSHGTDGWNMVVNRAMLTQNGRHILVQTKVTSGHGRMDKRVLVFDVSSFAPERKEDATSTLLPYANIPPDILSRIETPLGILSRSRIAFLDQDLWFCTFTLKSTYDHDEEVLRRHYFVPRDWTSTQSLEQCCMMEDGTLLCPKDDQVAVISCKLEGSGF